MDRKGEQIIYTSDEQKEFNVASPQTVREALTTAELADAQAHSLMAGAIIYDADAGIYANQDPETLLRHQANGVFAARLLWLAREIENLCLKDETKKMYKDLGM